MLYVQHVTLLFLNKNMIAHLTFLQRERSGTYGMTSYANTLSILCT